MAMVTGAERASIDKARANTVRGQRARLWYFKKKKEMAKPDFILLKRPAAAKPKPKPQATRKKPAAATAAQSQGGGMKAAGTMSLHVNMRTGEVELKGSLFQ